MPLIEGVLFCDGCGAEILGAPHVQDDRLHCCEGCAQGLACDCGVYRDDDSERTYSMQVTAWVDTSAVNP